MGVQQSYPHYRTATASTGVGQVAVLTSTTAIAAANASRTYLRIQNVDATNPVALGFGASAVALKGINLKAGESWEMPPNGIFTGAVNGIATTATCNVAYVEW